MLDNRKLMLDTHCEIYSMIKQHAAGLFWDFKRHVAEGKLVNGAVYVIGREQMRVNSELIKKLVVDNEIRVIFSNPAEGSETMYKQCQYQFDIINLIQAKKILVVSGGNQDPAWPHLQYDNFLAKVLQYQENLKAIQQYQEQYTRDRPYKFLFLNGRARPHRRYLLENLRPLLDQAIWSNLDTGNGDIQLLDTKYELEKYHGNMNRLPQQGFVKQALFNQEWADILLSANLYCDTYFSLVSETVFEYPHSFRTEKLWKPLAIGHPWIAVANCGFYKDLRDLGFRTFDGIIDESFDLIENNQDRLHRVTQVITDLCQQDLKQFLDACQETCKYNQQHLAEIQPKVIKEFPDRFFQFIKQHKFDE